MSKQILALAVIFAVTSLPAKADHKLSHAEYVAMVCDDIPTVASELLDEQSKSSYNSSLKLISKEVGVCESTKYTNLAMGYFQYSRALRYRAAGKEWRTEINQGITALTKCITDFYNTETGAKCQTVQERAISDKVDWGNKI